MLQGNENVHFFIGACQVSGNSHHSFTFFFQEFLPGGPHLHDLWSDKSCIHCVQRGMATSSIGKKVLKLGYIGAGGINFGTPEGPWNHAAKLEKFPGEVMPSVTGNRPGRSHGKRH